MKTQKLVTKEWLAAKVAANPSHVIGRVLVALLRRQTEMERHGSTTVVNNGVGFSKPDARIGTITAKTFLKYGELRPWQIVAWSKPNASGLPRIVKYAGQLNEIAIAKLTHNGNQL